MNLFKKLIARWTHAPSPIAPPAVGKLAGSLARWRRHGARLMVDPRAEAEWQRVLAERARRRAERGLPDESGDLFR
jgi:hypothetical protein